MACGDETDGGIQQGIHDIQVFLTGDTEDIFHALVLQTAHEQLSGLHDEAYPDLLVPAGRCSASGNPAHCGFAVVEAGFPDSRSCSTR